MDGSHESVIAAGSKRPPSDHDLRNAAPDATDIADADALSDAKRHDPGSADFGVDVELDLDAFVSQLEQAAAAAAAASTDSTDPSTTSQPPPQPDLLEDIESAASEMSIEEQLKGALASLGGLPDDEPVSGSDSADATVPPSLEPTPQPEAAPILHTPADHGIPELEGLDGLAELRAANDAGSPLAGDDNLDFPSLPLLPASLAAAVEPHPHTPTPPPVSIPRLPELQAEVDVVKELKEASRSVGAIVPADKEQTISPRENSPEPPKPVEQTAATEKPASAEVPNADRDVSMEDVPQGLPQEPPQEVPSVDKPVASKESDKSETTKDIEKSAEKAQEPAQKPVDDKLLDAASEKPSEISSEKSPEKSPEKSAETGTAETSEVPLAQKAASITEGTKKGDVEQAEVTKEPPRPLHDPSRQLPGPPSWERLERERKENERAAREKEEQRKRKEEENRQHELQALEADYQAELKAQLEAEQLQPPPDDTNKVLLELRQRSLSVLDSLSTQVLEFLSCSHYQDTLSAVVLPQSERGRAYRLVIDAFEATKRLYQGKDALQSPFLNYNVAGLNQHLRDNRIVIQRANLATFCAAVFGTIQIGFSDLNNVFIATFVPENGRLRKHVGALFLELKTQAYISALTQLSEDGDCTKALDQLFPLDLAQKLQNDLNGRPHLSPSEQDFVTRCMKRREIIAAEKSHTELARRYHWVPFLREVSDYIQKNHYSLLPKVFFGTEAGAGIEQAKARSRAAIGSQAPGVANGASAGTPTGRVMSPMSPADTPGTPSTPSTVPTGSEPARAGTPNPVPTNIDRNSPFPPLPPQTQIKTTPVPPATSAVPASAPATGSYGSGARPGFPPAHHAPSMRKPIPVSTGIQTGDTLAAYEAAKASAEGTDATRPKSSSSFTTRRTWTKEEEVALLKGMDRVQGPYWAQILELYGPGGSINEVLKDRTQVQLKDKARNLKMFFVRLGLPIPAVFQYVTGDYETRKSSGKKAANRRVVTPVPGAAQGAVPGTVQGPVSAQYQPSNLGPGSQQPAPGQAAPMANRAGSPLVVAGPVSKPIVGATAPTSSGLATSAPTPSGSATTAPVISGPTTSAPVTSGPTTSAPVLSGQTTGASAPSGPATASAPSRPSISEATTSGSISQDAQLSKEMSSSAPAATQTPTASEDKDPKPQEADANIMPDVAAESKAKPTEPAQAQEVSAPAAATEVVASREAETKEAATENAPTNNVSSEEKAAVPSQAAVASSTS